MEQWQVYNEYGKKIPKIITDNVQLSAGEYHLAVEAWIVNSKNQILLQQRSEALPLLPGYWALTTGRVQLGEDSAAGCLREVEEELGIALCREELAFICRIPRQDETHLLWDLYAVYKDVALQELCLQKEEVAQVKWVDKAEFLDMLTSGLIYEYPEIHEVLDAVLSRCQIDY